MNIRGLAMKKFLFAIMLVTPAFAADQKQPSNPADYTTTVHVQSSRLIQQCTDVTNGNSFCVWAQQLTTLIDGKKYELGGRVKVANLLRVGDYKAKSARQVPKEAYEYSSTYEFLFPDGQTRQYSVIGESE